MLHNKSYEDTSFAPGHGNAFSITTEDFDEGKSTLEVIGTGEIKIINTGGSSASEGGMGNDNTDDKAKGDLTKPGEEKGESMRGDESELDTSWDPIKKSVREAEKASGRE